MKDRLRHLFILNPAAGKGHHEKWLRKAAQSCFSDTGFELVLTEAPGHATEIARQASLKGDPVRLYACGGDGTLHEVANGAARFENAQVACVPIGTGNDYIKVFGGKEDFLNLQALKTGVPVPVDLIRTGDGYSMNLCSMGFDAEVALNLSRFRKLPLIPGSMAYHLSILYCLMKKMQTPFEIRIDDGEKVSGSFLLCVVADGRYYGGSYQAAPDARPDDGILDFVICDRVGRIAFAKMVNKYRIGDHQGIKILHHFTGRKLEISSPGLFALNCDGEYSEARAVTFEVEPSALRFVVPRSVLSKESLANHPKDSENSVSVHKK